MSTGEKAGRSADAGKRRAILDAARRVFLSEGFAAASIERIAAEAGVSKVTVYSHFGDKRGLFTAAIGHECARISGRFTLDNLPPGNVRNQLLAIGEAIVAFLSRPEMVQFERRIAAETAHDPEIGAAFLEAGPRAMKRALSDLFADLYRRGEVDISDMALAAEQFAALCKGMGDLERRFGHPSDPAQEHARIAGAVEMFCRAYGRSSPPARPPD